MKIAFSNLACPEWTVEEAIVRGTEYGYDGIEIRLFDGQVIPSTLTSLERARIRHALAETSLTLVGIGASTAFAMDDEAVRRKQEEELVRHVEQAASLGAPFVRTFGGTYEAADRDTATGRVAESLQRVADRTQGTGVAILLETHDDFSASPAVRAVMQQVSSPAVGALWDTHHPVRMGESAGETFDTLQPWLRHVHLKDARRRGQDWDLVLFGEGDIPLTEILALLRNHAYAGYLCVEWERRWHMELAPADVALPAHLAILRQWLQG